MLTTQQGIQYLYEFNFSIVLYGELNLAREDMVGM